MVVEEHVLLFNKGHLEVKAGRNRGRACGRHAVFVTEARRDLGNTVKARPSNSCLNCCGGLWQPHKNLLGVQTRRTRKSRARLRGERRSDDRRLEFFEFPVHMRLRIDDTTSDRQAPCCFWPSFHAQIEVAIAQARFPGFPDRQTPAKAASFGRAQALGCRGTEHFEFRRRIFGRSPINRPAPSLRPSMRIHHSERTFFNIRKKRGESGSHSNLGDTVVVAQIDKNRNIGRGVAPPVHPPGTGAPWSPNVFPCSIRRMYGADMRA